MENYRGVYLLTLTCPPTDLIIRECFFFFFSSRRRHTRFDCDWSSDVCSSDLRPIAPQTPATNNSTSRSVRVIVLASFPRRFQGLSESFAFDPFANDLCLATDRKSVV